MTSDPTSVPEPEGTKECERALWGSSDSPFCVVASLLRGRAESQKVWGRWLSLLVCGGPRPCTSGGGGNVWAQVPALQGPEPAPEGPDQSWDRETGRLVDSREIS